MEITRERQGPLGQQVLGSSEGSVRPVSTSPRLLPARVDTPAPRLSGRGDRGPGRVRWHPAAPDARPASGSQCQVPTGSAVPPEGPGTGQPRTPARHSVHRRARDSRDLAREAVGGVGSQRGGPGLAAPWQGAPSVGRGPGGHPQSSAAPRQVSRHTRSCHVTHTRTEHTIWSPHRQQAELSGAAEEACDPPGGSLGVRVSPHRQLEESQLCWEGARLARLMAPDGRPLPSVSKGNRAVQAAESSPGASGSQPSLLTRAAALQRFPQGICRPSCLVTGLPDGRPPRARLTLASRTYECLADSSLHQQALPRGRLDGEDEDHGTGPGRARGARSAHRHSLALLPQSCPACPRMQTGCPWPLTRLGSMATSAREFHCDQCPHSWQVGHRPGLETVAQKPAGHGTCLTQAAGKRSSRGSLGVAFGLLPCPH